MSNHPSLSYEGITIKVIIQKGDLTYHGVPVQTRGSGALFQFAQQFANVGTVKDIEKSITTRSDVLVQVPQDVGEDAMRDLSLKVADMRVLLMSRYQKLQQKVKDFFGAVEGAKLAALGNSEMKRLDSSELDQIKAAIDPYNVGPVLTVKIQARLFSQEYFPGAKELRDGGYSIVRVLYKFYLPDMDLNEAMSIVMDAWNVRQQNESIVGSQSYKNTIYREVRPNGKVSVRIISNPAVPTVVDSSGQEQLVTYFKDRDNNPVRDKLQKMDFGF